MAVLHRAYKISMPYVAQVLTQLGGVPSEQQCRDFLGAGGFLQQDLMIDLAIDDQSEWDVEESRLVLLGMASVRVAALSERIASGWHVLEAGFPNDGEGRSVMDPTLRGDQATLVPGLTELVGEIRRVRFLAFEQAKQQLELVKATDAEASLRRLEEQNDHEVLFEEVAHLQVFPDSLDFVATTISDAWKLLREVTPDDFLMVFLD